MTTIAIRDSLIASIWEIDDTVLLNEVYDWLQIQSSQAQGNIYFLSDKQRLTSEQARQAIENGDRLSEKEANAQVNEWLEK